MMHEGIEFAVVESKEEGFDIAKKVMYEMLDSHWALFLSGGKTPLPLYQQLALESKFSVGAVAMVDERYGNPGHPLSNELSIRESGLIEYLSEEYVKFYPVLEEGKSREELAASYNQVVTDLFSKFQKRFAILGIGEDGHTASIAPNRADFTDPLFDPSRQELLVSEFLDPVPSSPEGNPAPPNGFGERITLTLNALSQMDRLVVIAFGEKKKDAFEKLFAQGPIEECPIRFVKDPAISPKTLFITDQKV